MKALYQVENGYMGEAYTRCYVWADSESEARELALERFAFEAERHPYPPDYVNIVTVEAIDSESFASFPSDSGFELTDWRAGYYKMTNGNA